MTGAGGPVMLAASLPELGRGDVLAGRYQIEAVIGNGGSGQVMRAFDRVTRDLVALKVLRPEFAADPIWVERFSRELRVGRQIQHPNVCRVFDIGDADGNRFLSMELATGGTVRGQLDPDVSPRSLEVRIADARAVIDGVAALHAAGIVHRDLKPENILRMADGRLIVSDFGLATDPGAGPATTIMIGTPRYMAPEVVMGDPATARSDVWALGIVLHEILFGSRPNRSIARRGHRVYTPPLVGSVKERRLAQLCGRCSEDDPERRPASAVEVVTEFRGAMLGRRFTPLAVQRQIAWGVIAICGVASLGLVRDRWSSSAVASSSNSARSISKGVLRAQGQPADWGRDATKLAAFPGRLHCFSTIDGGKKVRAIWGTPRRAEDIEVKTGARLSADLLPETYEDGCPQVSPNGRSLIFERNTESGVHIFLSPSSDGKEARRLVRGSSPDWLPNGQEFAFDLDSRHAGIFSIPTGQMTIATDGITSPRQLAEKAVDASGTRLVLRYFTETLDNLIVVQALPSLTMLGHFLVPMSARRVQFSPAGDRVLFSLDGPKGVSQMVAADWRKPALTVIGGMPGADIRGMAMTEGGAVVASRTLKKNLWLDDATGSKPLTTDGQSDAGSMSSRGDLVIQRRLPDGRFVIVYRSATGEEQQLTQGPLHMTPTFFPDGSKWLYLDYTSHEIVQCRVDDKRCAPIYSDPLTPHWPTVDFSGSHVAYVTFMNMPRLHLLSLANGTRRDLGPVSAECAPVWASDARIWMTQPSNDRGQLWVEIDTATGERTGKVHRTTALPRRECELPPGVLKEMPDPSHRRVSVVVDETSELLRTHLH